MRDGLASLDLRRTLRFLCQSGASGVKGQCWWLSATDSRARMLGEPLGIGPGRYLRCDVL